MAEVHVLGAVRSPTDVQHGRAEQVTSTRAVVLEGAYAAHSERFVGKAPQPPQAV